MLAAKGPGDPAVNALLAGLTRAELEELLGTHITSGVPVTVSDVKRKREKQHKGEVAAPVAKRRLEASTNPELDCKLSAGKDALPKQSAPSKARPVRERHAPQVSYSSGVLPVLLSTASTVYISGRR